MLQGKLQHERTLQISQAALVWSAATEDQLKTFVRTGVLEAESIMEPQDTVMPFPGRDAMNALFQRGVVPCGWEGG